MKKLFFLLLWLPAICQAQTSRIATLQNARNVTISDGERTAYQLIKSGESRKLYRKDGKLIAGRDTFETRQTKLRIMSLTRFAIDEDSTTFGAKHTVDHGLLAFRRSMNVGQWNTIVVPFSLTGSQLRDAFGEDAQLAGLQGVTDGPTPTVEFLTIDLGTDDVVLEANTHYLLKPTREPDIIEGGLTSVAYGSGTVVGPVYAIPNVTLLSNQSPRLQTLRSDDTEVRVRVRGTYTSHNVGVTSSPRYMLNDEGQFYQIAEATDQKGFRSLYEDASPNEKLPLRFYINGIGEDLTSAIHDVQRSTFNIQHSTSNVHDLQGRRVTTPKKGLYIINGKKVFIK